MDRCRRKKPAHEWPLIGLWETQHYARYVGLQAQEKSGRSTGGLVSSKNSNADLDLVVAQCLNDVGWMQFPVENLNFRRVTVYSKCGYKPEGMKKGWHLVTLPNVGRNDHTFLHHIVANYDDLAEGTLFIKDNSSPQFSGQASMPLSSLATLVMQVEARNGFACARTSVLRHSERHHGHMFTRVRFPSPQHPTLVGFTLHHSICLEPPPARRTNSKTSRSASTTSPSST